MGMIILFFAIIFFALFGMMSLSFELFDDSKHPACKCPKCKKKDWADWYQEYPETDRYKHSKCLNCGYTFDKKLHYKSARGLWMSEKTPLGSDYIE